jgi:high-affinity iron transporter
MKESLTHARSGEYELAKNKALLAYLDGIEPIEVILKAQDPNAVQDLELAMGAYRKMVDQKKSALELEGQAENIYHLIQQAQELMDNKTSSFWLTFLMAGSIILREGIEAFLIIIIMLSVLKKANALQVAKYVHAGWILALALGFVGWYSADKLMKMSSMGREVMEGAAALVAVVVLFYLGIWMHGLSEAKRWNQFVKERIHKLLDAKNALGMAAFSFMVVFREAFESVLFLSAIGLDAQEYDNHALGLGVMVAFALVGGLALVVMRYSAKLPVNQLFRYSSYVLAVLAVILAGKGIHALQEAGYVGISAWPISWRSEWLGVYPTVESMMAQLVVAIALVAARWVQSRRSEPKNGAVTAA